MNICYIHEEKKIMIKNNDDHKKHEQVPGHIIIYIFFILKI